jgi:hypothetical protein
VGRPGLTGPGSRCRGHSPVDDGGLGRGGGGPRGFRCVGGPPVRGTGLGWCRPGVFDTLPAGQLTLGPWPQTGGPWGRRAPFSTHPNLTSSQGPFFDTPKSDQFARTIFRHTQISPVHGCPFFDTPKTDQLMRLRWGPPRTPGAHETPAGRAVSDAETATMRAWLGDWGPGHVEMGEF